MSFEYNLNCLDQNVETTNYFSLNQIIGDSFQKRTSSLELIKYFILDINILEFNI
jgi:hypothetical protein